MAEGLLALWETTHERAYLDGARRAGTWLLSVAQPAAGGLRWPDYDDAHAVSDDRFTSFDDGAAGISDLLWQLGQATGDRRFTSAARAGMRWLSSRAEGVGRLPCPAICRWRYEDGPDRDYRTGLGEGVAGIAYAYVLFAERTGDPGDERRARGAAAYLESQMTPAGAIPEQAGATGYDTGFLSGAAGDAYLFLRLYRHTHERRWRSDAERLLAWLGRQERPQVNGSAWPIELDPEDGDDSTLATGFEEGAAGIGWVELEAYRQTHRRSYLRRALRAGDWLAGGQGPPWPEDRGASLVHTSLNNGSPGIAWFLHDLWLETHRGAYERAARRTVAWLSAHARSDRQGTYWYENAGHGRQSLPADPSWHWGTAGVAAFLARMRGWPVDMPGEEAGW